MYLVKCTRCQKTLSSLGSRTGFELLEGIICEKCGRIECLECKKKGGNLDDPCSWCGGSVVPAYVHEIHKYQKSTMGKGCWIGMIVCILLFVGFCLLVSFLGNEDREDWRVVKNLNEVGSYQKYLEKHPQGKYAREAFRKIEYLKYSKAVKEDTIEGYRGYCQEFFSAGLDIKIRNDISRRYYEKIASSESLAVWRSFVSQITDAPYHQEAKNRLKAMLSDIRKETNEQIKDASTIGIRVDIDLKSAGDSGEKSKISTEIHEFFRPLIEETSGLEMVDPAGKFPDLLVLIQIKGTSDPEEVTGTVSLVSRLKTVFKKSFTALADKLFSPYFPDDSLAHSMIDVLYKAFGRHILFFAMKSGDEMVRSAAVYVLQKRVAELKEAKTRDLLIQELKNDYEDIRFAAFNALGQLGDKKAIPHLQVWLKNDDIKMKKHAADALQKLGWNPDSIEDKIDFLICQGRYDQLGEFKGKAVKPLIEVVQRRESEVLSGIGVPVKSKTPEEVLVKIGQPAVGPLIECLESNDEYLKDKAYDILLRIGPSALIPILDVFVFVKKPGYVRGALWNIIEKYGRESVPYLIEALGKSDDETLKGLIVNLGLLKDERAIGPLIAQLNNQSEIVRLMAVGALETITGKRFGQNYDKWRKWWRER